jgi:predicted protein tyrosine phosphatase
MEIRNKASKNQLMNTSNCYQTDVKRVLSICSAGMLRSPTVANALYYEYGYNTRSCGATDFALIPISEALLVWADEVVLVHNDVLKYLSDSELDIIKDKLIVLNISDTYEWNEKALVDQILTQYKPV